MNLIEGRHFVNSWTKFQFTKVLWIKIYGYN